MRYSIVALAAAVTAVAGDNTITGTAGSQPSGQPPITAVEGSLPLGATCSDTKQCANGADCYGTTAETIRRCGNFNASCKDDSQCAYNTCSTDSGLCSGFLPSQSYKANTASQTLSAAGESTTYACNPAHQYPEGQQCVSTNGGLTLLPATTSGVAAASTGFACNPAHQYPEGQQCVSTNGGLTLLPATTSFAASAPSTGFACNPAHQYPAGQVCTEIGGQLTLVTEGSPAATATATALFPPIYPGGNNTVVAPTGTGAVYPSSSITPYQGSASVAGTLSGLAALVAGVVAFIL
ncbi:hypothetical protein DOTSEDRAFT_74524 [Dothistroma septosporum NZE10]|uniref:Uncharacterized protein n=1 Tax=Dothistroma septosporum (strain NZE10 / CBS 128990) TaxID=675120 RepID=N1PF42_DOTSN|nr:hypothetical protein DOTSEDRAFT_74524 [Dothistroma septosporum NZE10]